MRTISVLEDYSEFPGLRHCNISEKSGEEFYHTVLNRTFKESYENDEKLMINLDNTAGYASSFLDEAFGNLVFDFTLEIVKKTMEIISMQEPHWKEMIEKQTYIQWEIRRKNNQPPKVTIKHDEWYRLVGNKLEFKVWELPTAV
jgi:hypothetical protein